ncbi:hypothetical protein [Alkalihalobacillus sp. AL-G]|uniref:hypothetical protein n=1 Tax=Alkalihalobacillus sp. AL-G TaxID=2926399 RepID=UPI002729E1AF|nr:hypothetical protein [Alkalihalobacillus sp. AL-G]WLD94724.1 hypothetical protein MOJ78_07535 [Alkalihalobacillus sp. AL-G]
MDNIRKSIDEFQQMLSKYPDDLDSAQKFYQFFLKMMRAKQPDEELPLVEMVTILKYDKPTTFHFLKRQSSYNVSLNLLTQIEMNLESAITNIKELLEEKEPEENQR